jgi:hypothetical protein
VRVLFLGAPVDDVNGPVEEYHAKFERTGRNTGNLLIGSAFKRQIAWSSYEYGAIDPTRIDEDFDLIAIAAANFLYAGFDFGWLADVLEQTSLPCIVAGLGAQAPSKVATDVAIPEGTIRFVKIVAERSQSLGVRGEFTADVLARMGIDNVRLTGCPSLYWSLQRSLSIDKTSNTSELQVAVNGSRNVIRHSHSPHRAREFERDLLALAMTRNYDYVLQNEFPEIDALHADSSDSQHDSLLVHVATELGVEGERYPDYVRAHGRLFFSVEAWSAYIRTKDFVCGTRFHGNVIALINGVPSVIFVHDARTSELCALSKIPCYQVDSTRVQELERLYASIDYSDFSDAYPRLYDDYVAFFEENGVPHRL